MYICVHTGDQSLVQIILKEYWKLDLTYGPPTPTDDRVQGASQMQMFLTMP